MAKRCLIEVCKREAETHCYHCSQDVCTKHYLEHKKWIQEQLHPLIDDMNLVYDRLSHNDKNEDASVPECLINAYNQLDNWHAECHQRIDIIYQRVRYQVENIVKTHRHNETQNMVHTLESLKKLRQQFQQLLKEDDVTYRQLETMKRQLEELKKKEQERIKYPDIRIITHKIDIDNLITVTTDTKHPSEKQQQPKDTSKAAANK